MLTPGNRLQAAAHIFGHISGAEESNPDQRPDDTFDTDLRWQEQRQHQIHHKQDRNQRNTAYRFNESNADPTDNGQF